MSEFIIDSPSNPSVKRLVKLRQARARREEEVILVEGCRELDRALQCKFELLELYVWPAGVRPDWQSHMEPWRLQAQKSCELSERAFAKVSVREQSDGVIALLKRPADRALSELASPILLLAVEGIEKPGNLGALLRSADGAGFDAVVVVDQVVDSYSPTVIRTSLGTVFRVPVVHATLLELKEYCRARQQPIFGAALSESSVSYREARAGSSGACLMLGEEAQGLSSAAMAACDQTIVIPMRGIADSLNVSAAGSILMYHFADQLKA